MKQTPVLRAAASGRVSTDRQDLSEASQRRAMAAFAEREGFPLDPADVYFDNAKSGRTIWRERPQGQRCYEALASGRCQVLIAHKVDRMCRDAIDMQTTVRDIVAMGPHHTVYFALNGQTFNARLPHGQFMIAMLAWMADMEWFTIKERITDALEEKWQMGESPAHAPYGWDKVEGTRVNRQGVAAPTLVDNVAEQIWLAQILAWRGDRLPAELHAGLQARVVEFSHALAQPAIQAPGWGPERIANALNTLGVPTKQGVRPYRRRNEAGELVVAGHTSGQWHERTVHGILTNRWTARWLSTAVVSGQ